jgi:hypothetical protein
MYEIMKWIDGMGLEITEYLILLALLISLLFIKEDGKESNWKILLKKLKGETK